jgi:hypothetical protein
MYYLMRYCDEQVYGWEPALEWAEYKMGAVVCQCKVGARRGGVGRPAMLQYKDIAARRLSDLWRYVNRLGFFQECKERVICRHEPDDARQRRQAGQRAAVPAADIGIR